MADGAILRTDRLVLRRARMTDLEAMHRVLSEPRAMRYWSTPEHESLAQTEDWLRGMVEDETADDFVIERGGEVIGKAGAWRLPEVGFILHPQHWQQGLMHEAMGAVIPWLFARHAMPALTAEADPRNQGSIALLRKLGFAETHRAERTMQWRDEWCDSIYFALPRPA